MNIWKLSLTKVKNLPLTSLLFLLLLAITQPIWHGYQFGVSDHSIQFSIMNRIMDETLYPNDPMLDTAEGYVSFFPRFMVVLIEIFGNMELLYFALHILTYFFYFTIIYYISLLLFDKIGAIIAVILLSTSKIVLGGSSIHFTGFYPSFFILPFVLLAIYLFLKEKYLIAYAIIGITFNFHVLISGYTFCMFACYSLLSIISVQSGSPLFKKKFLKELGKQLAVFVICALPAIIWIMSTHGSMSDEWIRLLRIRSSHHSFPFSWEESHYVNYLLFLSTGVLAFLYVPKAEFHHKILIFVLAIVIMCIAGVVFTEYYPVKLILRGQLFRSTNFLTIFWVIYASNYIRHSWKNTILHKFAVVIIFLALFLSSYFNLLILGLILCLFAENIIISSRDVNLSKSQILNRRFGIVLFVSIAILVRNFAPHSSFPKSLNLNGIVSLINTFLENKLLLAIICASILLVWFRLLRKKYQKTVSLLIVVSLIFYVVPSAYKRLHPDERYSKGWRDVQMWAKKNTKKDAVFLTPPYLTGFRIFSQRPIVGEWKDGTQQYFDTEYSYEWWERMQDMKSDSWGDRDFNSLDKKQYVKLAGKYNASYLVLPKDVSINLPEMYENDKYVVYRFD